jgi:tRNA-binding protein
VWLGQYARSTARLRFKPAFQIREDAAFMNQRIDAAASWADFERIGMRAGTIRKVESFHEARNPAYKLWIDFGPFGIKQSSAQLTALYRPEDLVNRQVICATGLGPKRIAGFNSEVLVTGFARADGAIILAATERTVADGSSLC